MRLLRGLLLSRAESAPEAGNLSQQQQNRWKMPRSGSVSLEEMRACLGISSSFAGGEAGDTVVAALLPARMQHSLAWQAAIGGDSNGFTAADEVDDPLAWCSGLLPVGGGSGGAAGLQATAQQLQAELSTQLGRRLRRAVAHLDLELVAALVLTGADVASADAEGRTALHELAAAAKDEATAEKAAAPILCILLCRGAQVLAQDSAGRTPVHVAASSSMARLLLAAEAAAESCLTASSAAEPQDAAAVVVEAPATEAAAEAEGRLGLTVAAAAATQDAAEALAAAVPPSRGGSLRPPALPLIAEGEGMHNAASIEQPPSSGEASAAAALPLPSIELFPQSRAPPHIAEESARTTAPSKQPLASGGVPSQQQSLAPGGQQRSEQAAPPPHDPAAWTAAAATPFTSAGDARVAQGVVHTFFQEHTTLRVRFAGTCAVPQPMPQRPAQLRV